MLVALKGKHIHLSEAVQTYVDGLAEATISKYHLHPIEMHAHFDKDPHGLFIFSLVAHMAKAWTTRVSGEDRDAYKAIDGAFAHLAAQIRQHKKRDVDHQRHHDNHHFEDKVKRADNLAF